MAKFIYRMQNILDIKGKLEEQAKIVLDVPVSKDTIGRALKKINFDLT